MSSLNKEKLYHKLCSEIGQPADVWILLQYTSGHGGWGGRLEKSLSNWRTPKQRHCKILYYKAKETLNPPGAAVCISTGLSLPLEGHGDTPKPRVTLDLHCVHVAQSQLALLSWHLLSNHLWEIILGSRRGGAEGGRGGAEGGRNWRGENESLSCISKYCATHWPHLLSINCPKHYSLPLDFRPYEAIEGNDLVIRTHQHFIPHTSERLSWGNHSTLQAQQNFSVIHFLHNTEIFSSQPPKSISK